MRKNVIVISMFLFAAIFKISFAQTIVSISDFKILIGNWTGTLTYLDYTKNIPVTLPAKLNIVEAENDDNLVFEIIFPEEPQANYIDTLLIKEEGKVLREEKVISKQKFDDGMLEIVTETSGKDGNDNKDAFIRHRYYIKQNTFTLKKEVKFLDENEWIIRNEFRFERND